MIRRRLVITGRVQNVFYRDWFTEQATALGLDGWIRNRADGSVEAVVQGPSEMVETIAAKAHQGSPASRVARVLCALASAGLVTLAALSLLGERLSLVHIVALQFVAGVGLDYALFFARTQVDDEERARTLRTLVTCNAMTLLTFGLLLFCHTPILREIGLPVSIGAFTALIFGFMFVGPMTPRPD